MAKWKILKRKMKPAESLGSDTSDSEEEVSLTRSSEGVPKKKYKWTNKQRLLIFASRGITYRDRHLMNSLRSLLAHSKEEVKFEKKDNLAAINEIAEMKNCNKVMYMENRRKSDTYMWLANMRTGPTLKFLIQNVSTMEELKFSGNCLRGSRPLLSFDPTFNNNPWSRLVKEVLAQTFGTPAYHPRSQPFFDHVFVFRLLDKRTWFRNYQIVEEDGSLVEIGPRFCLNLIKIFDGPFSDVVIYTNPHYVAPNKIRRLAKKDSRYVERKEQKVKRQFIEKLPMPSPEDPHLDVFETKPSEEAVGIEKHAYYRLNFDVGQEKKPRNLKKKKVEKPKK
ncbi:ribosome biogenesis protein BRX1-like [Tropilaelaps mercedesae]|uniref:Ribosome biogenesis protein BRX1 homolog n=1 Tax=Tropilaelaps mercedesae TaxID=418985 RepID=A0A1V9XKU7_9ACAR|nr:ribosome biogenesis protein BRX1-like [Tropilaelaps mercedesae]